MQKAKGVLLVKETFNDAQGKLVVMKVLLANVGDDEQERPDWDKHVTRCGTSDLCQSEFFHLPDVN